MSEFECRQGHIVPSRYWRCPICGEPIVRMDGKTASELARIERYWEESVNESDEENVDEEGEENDGRDEDS